MKIAFSFQLSACRKKRNRSCPLTADSSKLTATRGFTLIEMIIAVGLFAIVMVVCIGALLSLVDANKKAQSLQSVINNLNIAIDGTVRAARMGSDYHGAGGDASCGGGDYATPHDCASGGTIFAFEPFHDCSAPGTSCDGNGNVQPWVYSFAQDENGVGRIYRSEDGAAPIAITAPDVSIDDVKFFVVGTTPGDDTQPKVVIVIKGTAGAAGTKAQTTFHIQATAVQRLLDL